MRCQCGADLPDGAMFCGECGRAVHGGVASEVPVDEFSDLVVAESAVDESPTRVVESVTPPQESQPRSQPEPSPAPILVHAEPDEATRLPDRRPPRARFTLHFSTGESVTVEGSGLIGRRPTAQPGEYFDEYVALDDPGRSVSKTHLEFGQEGGALWVSDRFSANGTVVREPDRSPRLCPGGTRARVARGSRVEIGEQFFIVS